MVMRGKPLHLGKAAGHHGGAGAFAQTGPDCGTAGDRHDVLERPAQFGTHSVRGAIKAQVCRC